MSNTREFNDNQAPPKALPGDPGHYSCLDAPEDHSEGCGLKSPGNGFFARFFGWVRSWFSTIMVGLPYQFPGGGLSCHPIMVNDHRIRVAYSKERMQDLVSEYGLDLEGCLVQILREDIFKSTGILFSKRRIRKAARKV